MEEYVIDRERFFAFLKERSFRSINDFSKKSGINRVTLNDYLNNNRSIFSRAAELIAEALEVSPLSLLAQHEDPLRKKVMDRVRELISPIANDYPHIAFMILGSSAKKSAKKFSDFDVGLYGGAKALSSRQFLKIQDELEAKFDDLPLSIDLINLDAAPLWFLSEITYLPVFFLGSSSNFYHFLGKLDGIRKALKTH